MMMIPSRATGSKQLTAIHLFSKRENHEGKMKVKFPEGWLW